jgi:hypothetical protein
MCSRAVSGLLHPVFIGALAPADLRADGVVEMERLDATQRGDMHVTAWLEWFLACLLTAISVKRAPHSRKSASSLPSTYFKSYSTWFALPSARIACAPISLN